MSGNISGIATGFATALGTITGLRSYSYQPEQLNPPVGFPVLSNVQYHRAFSGGDVVSNWIIIVIVGRWTDRNAYTELDGYLAWSGTKSIRAALEADKTLSGNCSTLIVQSSADVSNQNQADAEFLEIRFQVEVHG